MGKMEVSVITKESCVKFRNIGKVIKKKIRKSKGPYTDPRGIPCCMPLGLDNLPFILVQIERFVRYDCNKLNEGPRNP